MRNTFKTVFYVNGSEEKNGIVPIMGRVTINGTIAQFSCKQRIPKDLWDAKGNRLKGKSLLIGQVCIVLAIGICHTLYIPYYFILLYSVDRPISSNKAASEWLPFVG